MYEVAHPPRARGGFRCSAGARWQKNGFRCSFGGSIGKETGFVAVRTPSAPASTEFACVFRCKNNEKTNLAPPFWRPDGQNGESGPQSAAITAPKPVWLPGGSGLLRRNPFACQMGCDRCAETRLPAKWDAIAAPELARLPSARQSQAPRNSFGSMAFCLAPAKAALGSTLTLFGAFTRVEGRNGTFNAKRLLLFRATALRDAMEPAIGFEPMTPALRERCSTD